MSPRPIAVVLALWAGAVQAQARGYVRTRVPGEDLCLHWSTRAYTFNYHSAGSQRTPGDAEFVAMDAAFDAWRALAGTCSDFQFIKGPMVGVAEIGYDPKAPGQTNVIVFRERACRDVVQPDDPCFESGDCANVHQCWDHSETTIALTTTTFSFKTGVIYDADIEFNAAPHGDGDGFLFTTISSPPCEEGAQSPLCVSTDVQNTLTHEIGHAVGLDHTDIPGSTMEASAPLGETRKRVIDVGTAEGFCTVYPAGDLTPPCEELAALDRRIVAVNRGTAGLDHLGCSAVPGGGVAGLLILAVWLGRLRARARRDPSSA